MSESTDRSSPWAASGYLSGYYTKESPFEEYFEERTDEDTGDNFVNGIKNPRWKALIKGGYNATTPSDGFKVSHKIGLYNVENYIRKYGGTPRVLQTTNYKSVIGRYLIRPHVDEVDVSALSKVQADNQAKIAFIRKARKLQTTFQGGIAVGETLRTINLIKNPFRSLQKGMFNYLGRLKKIGPRSSRLSSKRKREILADTWLEYSFGWLPLFNDISDAAEALANSKYMQDQLWGNVIGVGSDESVDDLVGGYGTTSFGVGFTGDLRTSSKVTVKYYGAVDIGSRAISNTRRIGFDASNWLPTAWELLPYSFLIDYVTNVSEIVSAASFARSSIRRISQTVIKEITLSGVNIRPVGDVSFNPDVEIDTYGTLVPSSVRSKRFSRVPFNGSLVPTLAFSLPTPGQLLNVAALGFVSRGLSRYFK